MKFHQLRPGARFRYRQAVLRKVSPLKACNETDDAQRLIPRSAEVTLLDERGEPVRRIVPATLAGSAVESALGHLTASFDHDLAQIEPPLTEVQTAQLRQALHRAVRDLQGRLAAAT
jgi:hypothetical protein